MISMEKLKDFETTYVNLERDCDRAVTSLAGSCWLAMHESQIDYHRRECVIALGNEDEFAFEQHLAEMERLDRQLYCCLTAH